MIQNIIAKNINRELYDQCVDGSKSKRIYANSYYLDTICQSSWGALIWDNYRAVLPYPLIRSKRHFFSKKISHIHYCQQLGIFALDPLEDQTIELFLSSLMKLNPLYYPFNSENSSRLKAINSSLINRTNFELDLDKPYKYTYQNYSSTLKKNLKNASKNELKYAINDISSEDFINFKIGTSQHPLHRTALRKLKSIIDNALQDHYGQLVSVSQNGKLCSAAFFLNSSDRIIYLAAATNVLGKSLGASHVLLDSCIQSHSNKPKVFDFEGSDNSGIALFFRRFGAKNKEYLVYQR